MEAGEPVLAVRPSEGSPLALLQPIAPENQVRHPIEVFVERDDVDGLGALGGGNMKRVIRQHAIGRHDSRSVEPKIYVEPNLLHAVVHRVESFIEVAEGGNNLTDDKTQAASL